MIAFFLSPIGRYLIAGFVFLASLGGIYEKGRFDERSYYKAKIERQKDDAIAKGDKGRADALRKLDDGELSNNWFRD